MRRRIHVSYEEEEDTCVGARYISKYIGKRDLVKRYMGPTKDVKET
jgi:hypothetical protein